MRTQTLFHLFTFVRKCSKMFYICTYEQQVVNNSHPGPCRLRPAAGDGNQQRGHIGPPVQSANKQFCPGFRRPHLDSHGPWAEQIRNARLLPIFLRGGLPEPSEQPGQQCVFPAQRAPVGKHDERRCLAHAPGPFQAGGNSRWEQEYIDPYGKPRGTDAPEQRQQDLRL